MENLMTALADVTHVFLALGLLLVSKITLDWLTPFKLDDQLSSKDNNAFGLSLVGYYLGVLIVYMGALIGDGGEEVALGSDLLSVTLWSLLGIVLLNLSRVILDRVVLRSFSTRKEIIEDRNCGLGAMEFGTYVGSALVIAGAISGQGGGLITALVFYALGQGALIVYAVLYQRITAYDFHEEIEKDNVAAGVAYAGNLIAMGMILMRGTTGDFVSWSANVGEFLFYLVAAFVLLLAGRFAIDGVLLPGRTLHQEISEDRNLNAGYLEGGVLMGLAGVIFLAL